MTLLQAIVSLLQLLAALVMGYSLGYTRCERYYAERDLALAREELARTIAETEATKRRYGVHA